MTMPEAARGTTHWRIDRWDAEQTAWVQQRSGLLAPAVEDFRRHGVAPYDVADIHGNLITTAGLTRLTNLLTAGGGQAITNTSARIGVGNGAGTAAVGDTDLSASAGSSNRWFRVMDATYPQVSAGVLTLKATFGSADGNFAWNEFGIDIGTPTVSSAATVNATLFNHKTSIAQGTKASGQTWAATATVTFS
ncbi:hypothetical protein [Nonomuraea typhae]|uniref:Minor tail protein n=1 Tax=Nonomuraea typhae TaxID=2603600 RepID=A0ABW7YQX5_9ACTN